MPTAEPPASAGPDPTDPAAEPGRRGRRRKRQPTAGDMVRSLAVLLIPVLVISVLFTRDPDRMPGTQAVDWQPVHSQAAEEAAFPVLAPTNLPDGWTPVRVLWDDGDQGRDQRWMVGWLSPQQVYFAVEQSNAASAAFIDRVTREGVADGTSTVLSQSWQRYESPDGRTRSLVLVGDRATTIVSADSSYQALEAFAGTLT